MSAATPLQSSCKVHEAIIAKGFRETRTIGGSAARYGKKQTCYERGEYKPDNSGNMDPWFGLVMKSIRVRNEYRSVNNKEAQDRRVVALCLLADIIEEEGV